MLAKYQEWIAALDLKNGGYGRCQEISAQMVAAFPELKQVRGHYYCSVWGKRGHFWCIDPDGNIVDPTAKQFPSHGTMRYETWEDSRPLPTGICCNCGEYTFEMKTFCSDECKDSYMEYLKTGIL